MEGLQTTWGWMVATYLFLGGLGAGTFCTTGVLYLAMRKPSLVHAIGAWISALCLGFGALLLLADVGQPWRAIVLFKSFVNMSSWMAIGAWLLFAGIVVDGLFALVSTAPVLRWLETHAPGVAKHSPTLRGVLAGVGIPLNLAIAVYTGLLLSTPQFRPLWHNPVLPVLFLTSALDVGIALLGGIAAFTDRQGDLVAIRRRLEVASGVAIALEAGALVWFFASARGISSYALSATDLVLSGPLALPFWLLVVGLGLGLPLVLAIVQARGLWEKVPLAVPVLASCLALLGGLLLRFVIVLGGVAQPLASPNLLQVLQGVQFLR